MTVFQIAKQIISDHVMYAQSFLLNCLTENFKSIIYFLFHIIKLCFQKMSGVYRPPSAGYGVPQGPVLADNGFNQGTRLYRGKLHK